MFSNIFGITKKRPWNQRRLLGQKPPLKLKEVWAIRIHLQLAGKLRDLALFNLAIDSKLRACDLIRLRVQDVCHSGRIVSRAVVIQQKTHRAVQFEVTEQTRSALSSWIHHRRLQAQDYVFPSRIKSSLGRYASS
jgi:integrase